MDTLSSSHNPIVIGAGDSELFKRLLPKNMMPFGRVGGTQFDKFGKKKTILLQLRKSEYSALPLLGTCDRSLLETAFKVQLSERCITVKKPVAVHTPGDIAAASRKGNRVNCAGFVVGRDFPCVVQDKYSLTIENGLHGVKHLLHASAVIFVFLMQLAQDVYDNQISAFGLNYRLDKVLPTLRGHKEREHHVVLVDKAKVRDVQVITNFIEFSEAFRPGGFLGIKLQIKHFLWPRAGMAHDGLTFGNTGGYVECQEAFTDLGRTKKEHVTGLGNEALDQPFKLRPGCIQVLRGRDSTDHA